MKVGVRPRPPDVTWTHPFIDIFLAELPLYARSILDVGCGRGFVGCIARIYRDPERLVGIDAFGEYLDFCRSLNVYSELRKLDLRQTPLPFLNKAFDAVVALEVIEHLDMESGLALLQEMERIGGRVIISTPAQFVTQGAYDNNPQQQHRSLWSLEDFRKRGYNTRLITVLSGNGIRIVSRRGRFVGKLVRLLKNKAQYILAVKTQYPENLQKPIEEMSSST